MLKKIQNYIRVVSVAVCFTGISTHIWAFETPAPLPELTIKNFDGKQVYPVTSRGEYIVSYWATWCSPCVKEMQTFDAIQQKLIKKGITPIFVNVERNSKKKVSKFFKKWNIKNLQSYTGDMYEALQKFDESGLPITILIRDGVVIDLIDLNTHKWDKKRTYYYIMQIFDK